MKSEEDLAARLTERLAIEEAEECLCQLVEQCITVGVLGEAEAQDLADELGFTDRQCDAVLLDDVAWRAKYGQGQAGAHYAPEEPAPHSARVLVKAQAAEQEHAGAPCVHEANAANVAVQEPHGEATPDSNAEDENGGCVCSEAMEKEQDGCGAAGLVIQVSSRIYAHTHIHDMLQILRLLTAERRTLVRYQCARTAHPFPCPPAPVSMPRALGCL